MMTLLTATTSWLLFEPWKPPMQMLRPQDWPALSDRRLRDQVAQRLQGLGRQLIAVGGEDRGRVEGYVSGWSDAAGAVWLATRPPFRMSDLAVLTLDLPDFEILERILGEEVPPRQATR